MRYLKFTAIVLFIVALGFSGCDMGTEDDTPPPMLPLLPPPLPPSTPSGVSASVESSSSITITWSPVADAVGYRIYRSTSSTGSFSFRGTFTTTSYTDTGLPSNMTYYYKVSAYNSGGESAQSGYVSATTLLVVPNAPTNVTATAMLSFKILVSWNSASNTNIYYIYRRTGSSGEFNKIATVFHPTTSYSDTEVEANTTYNYKISAYNIEGESPLSTTTGSATTLSSGAGIIWQNAVDIPSNGIIGDFPEGVDELWFKFSRTGAGMIYAEDRNYVIASSYSGDIVVDVYAYQDNALYYLMYTDLSPIENIDIGKGSGDPKNVAIGNWNGTYYVKVKPYNSLRKGTFKLYFTNL